MIRDNKDKIFKRGEIWTYIDETTYTKPRPILIMSNDEFNKESPTVNGFMISTNKGELYNSIELSIDNTKCAIQFHQTNTFSKRCLGERVTTIDYLTMNKVEKSIKILYGLIENEESISKPKRYLNFKNKEHLRFIFNNWDDRESLINYVTNVSGQSISPSYVYSMKKRLRNQYDHFLKMNPKN